MAERVHPQPTPDSEGASTHPSAPAASGTFVIQIPKEQIYRVPPPENADRVKRLSRRKPRSGGACCCCFRFCCASLLLVILFSAIAAGVFFLIFRPESPKYSVGAVSIKGLNLSAPSVSPHFDAKVTADNPNNKLGIYYEAGSSMEAYYKDVKLCDGVLPRFYQPTNNITVFKTTLKGSSIVLTSSAHNELVSAEKSGRTVPFFVKLNMSVRMKVGSVKTWRIHVKVRCDLMVDKLTPQSKIVSKDCDYSVKLW